MKNKMNRCCCVAGTPAEPVTVDRSFLLECMFSHVDFHGFTEFEANVSSYPLLRIMKGSKDFTDPLIATPPPRGTYGLGAAFAVGTVPASVATARIEFWGSSFRFEPADPPTSGYGAPAQSIRICAFAYPDPTLNAFGVPTPMVSRTILEEGVPWELTRDDDWLSSTFVTTPDIAAIVNQVTSSPSWDPLTSRLAVCFYTVSQSPDNMGSIFSAGGYRLHVSSPPSLLRIVYAL